VLREIFAVSDAVLAETLRAGKKFFWDEPERHAAPVRAALRGVEAFVERVDAEGEPLEKFAHDLVRAGGLAERAALIMRAARSRAKLERLLAHAQSSGCPCGAARVVARTSRGA